MNQDRDGLAGGGKGFRAGDVLRQAGEGVVKLLTSYLVRVLLETAKKSSLYSLA